MDKLEEAGIKKVVCIAVAEPEEVSKWADKVGLTGTKIEVWADTKGAWTRMLGLDVNQYDEPGPRSHRCITAHVPNVQITGCSCIRAHAQHPVICYCCPAALCVLMLSCVLLVPKSAHCITCKQQSQVSCCWLLARTGCSICF